MKLRIKGNSIRIRLTKTEVAQFGEKGYWEEKTEFGNTTLTYAIQKDSAAKELSAKMEGTTITMILPESIANEWTSTNIVGFQNQYQLPTGTELFLLIEKDFVCLDNTFEDQSDNYPNPNAHC